MRGCLGECVLAQADKVHKRIAADLEGGGDEPAVDVSQHAVLVLGRGLLDPFNRVRELHLDEEPHIHMEKQGQPLKRWRGRSADSDTDTERVIDGYEALLP